MSRYRKIDPRIWNDAKFRALSDSAKLVFFMLLTHPNMTALGAMRATVSGLAEELGWDVEAFREAFREVISKDMAWHDQKACFIALTNFLKYNPPESPNVIKAWVGALDLLPECSLKHRVITLAREFAEGMSEGFAKALPEAFAKGMPYQEQEQEQECIVPNGTRRQADQSLPNCPHDDIVRLYHEKLPELPAVRLQSDARQKAMRAFWRWVLTSKRSDGQPRANDADQALTWISAYFERARANDFLMGRSQPGKGHEGWRCDLDYLLSEKGRKQVIEKTVDA